MTPALAIIAVEEFERRRSAMREASRSGRVPVQQAEANARCWLAIACAAGASIEQLPDLSDPAFPDRALEPWQIEPEQNWKAELARARDAAATKAIADPTERELAMRSFGLASLALHLGAPGPAIERKAA